MFIVYIEGKYFGTLLNNKRHGQGSLLSGDGIYYEGLWANDLPHGYGFKVSFNPIIIVMYSIMSV